MNQQTGRQCHSRKKKTTNNNALNVNLTKNYINVNV